MSHFFKDGNIFTVSPEDGLNLYKKLPVGNYTVVNDQLGNLFLETVDSFESPKKLYGDAGHNATKILSTFLDRPSSTGIMLCGEKGSGKTLLAKMLSINAAEIDVPTIIINTPYVGDKFNKFLQNITQPCIILFDEFEKVYSKEKQEGILTLLDGVYPSRKLFILTVNDKYKVDVNMRNRPGRIYYLLDYKGLSTEFISEYCEDNLVNKKHLTQILSLSTIFDAFNFDMLKALIEEINRFDEEPAEAIKMLNVKPEFSGKVTYDLSLIIDGVEVPDNELRSLSWTGNPIIESIALWHDKLLGVDQYGVPEEEFTLYKFTSENIYSIDPAKSTFIFAKDNAKLRLIKQIEKNFDYRNYF